MSPNNLTLDNFISDDVIRASEANGLDFFTARWLRENPRRYSDLWQPGGQVNSYHWQHFIQACPVAAVLEMFAAKALGEPTQFYLPGNESLADVNRRVEVAKNKWAPLDVLKALSRDARVLVRKAVASNTGAQERS